ncbi:acyltransferase family protein [Rothia sp. CCM 9418]|uniref:acyltransferase family protein n=1 Tax=Rothia sp. CCM 9418 TaxID=3402661 RepID=UPI003AE93237
MSKTRLVWMDSLRGMAVLFIIIYHSTTVPIAWWSARDYSFQVPDIINSINVSLSPYRVPCLLIISGLLLNRSRSKGTKRYLLGKFYNIFWAYLVWCSIIILTTGNFSQMTNVWFWAGGNILWYLPVIFFCYIAGTWRPFNIPWLVYSFVFLALLFLKDPSTNAVIRILWFGAFFFVGAYLAKHLTWLQERMPLAFVWALGAISVYGIYHALTSDISEHHLLNFFTSVCGSIFLIWLAPYFPEAKFMKMVQFVGQNSIIFYVAHGPVMYVLLRLLGTPETLSWYVIAFMMLLSSLTACFCLAKYRKYIDFLFVFPQRPRGEGS